MNYWRVNLLTYLLSKVDMPFEAVNKANAWSKGICDVALVKESIWGRP